MKITVTFTVDEGHITAHGGEEQILKAIEEELKRHQYKTECGLEFERIVSVDNPSNRVCY